MKEMINAINSIDRKTNTYVEFEVMTDQGPSKRTAFDYMTGRGIVEGWKDKIISIKVYQNGLQIK